MPGKTVKILSVDGGGIRGYLAALILEEIERRRDAAGKVHHLSRCFDLFAGTSTGSLITLGLTTPQFTPVIPAAGGLPGSLNPMGPQSLQSFPAPSRPPGVPGGPFANSVPGPPGEKETKGAKGAQDASSPGASQGEISTKGSLLSTTEARLSTRIARLSTSGTKGSTAHSRVSSGKTQDYPGDITTKSTEISPDSSGLSTDLSTAEDKSSDRLKRRSGRFFWRDGSRAPKYRTPKYRAEDIARMYRHRGIEIFPRHIFNQLKSVRHAFVEKYDAGNFDRVLLENFGDLTLKDLLSTVLLTSYDTLEGKPLIMKNLPKEDNFLVREAARGSSAAPTYFRPVEVTGLETGKKHCLVDGGVFANNPAMCAYVEARRLFPMARQIIILSLGSGQIQSSYSLKRMKSWGYVEWVLPSNGVPLISMMSSGQNRCVDYQLEHFPGVSYLRLNPSLEGCSDEMDDAGEKNMECLKRAAQRCIAENDELISWIAKIL
jgi:uncharacterized protein